MNATDALAVPIETPRLLLEPLRAAHASACFNAFAEPRLYRYIDMPMPIDSSDLRRRFTRWIDGSGDPDERWLNWIAIERRTATPAGWFQATVRAGDERAAGIADIAYFVFDTFQRRGVAVEAVGALCDWLFSTMPIRSIRARTDERNRASIRVALATGFLPEGDPIPATLHGENTRDLVFRRWRPA